MKEQNLQINVLTNIHKSFLNGILYVSSSFSLAVGIGIFVWFLLRIITSESYLWGTFALFISVIVLFCYFGVIIVRVHLEKTYSEKSVFDVVEIKKVLFIGSVIFIILSIFVLLSTDLITSQLFEGMVSIFQNFFYKAIIILFILFVETFVFLKILLRFISFRAVKDVFDYAFSEKESFAYIIFPTAIGIYFAVLFLLNLSIHDYLKVYLGYGLFEIKFLGILLNFSFLYLHVMYLFKSLKVQFSKHGSLSI